VRTIFDVHFLLIEELGTVNAIVSPTYTQKTLTKEEIIR